MDKCPYCEGDNGVEWKDYGNIYIYQQFFGATIEKREVVDILNKTNSPIWCKCMDCGKRLKILDVEKLEAD